MEATKSWTYLTKEEKTAIKNEYDDLVLSHRKMYAEGLKNIEPYCKKKRAMYVLLIDIYLVSILLA